MGNTVLCSLWKRSVNSSVIHPYLDKSARLALTARVAENATILGDVTLDAGSSVWFGAVLRGDEASIRLGEGSNVQDNAVIHCDEACPVSIGREVTIGHAAIVHGCTVEDRCLIGMGAILLSGCVIGHDSLVAAGALVTQGAVIPPCSLVMGAPAKVVRPLRPEDLEDIRYSAETYRCLSARQLPLATDLEEEVRYEAHS